MAMPCENHAAPQPLPTKESMTPGQHATRTPTDESVPVKLALEQSQEVKAKVEECAEDINVANAVVKQGSLRAR